MKKRLMISLILALSLALAGVALTGAGQAASFPGATVGFQWSNNPNVYTVLTLKLNGTAKMSHPLKLYTVTGVTFDVSTTAQYPVSGSAYVKGTAGSQVLLLSLSGTFANQFIDLGGDLFQQTGLGTIAVRASQGAVWGAPAIIGITALTAAQIKALTLP